MSQCSYGEDLVLMAATLAISLSRDVDADGANVLAGFFSALGDNLAIIAAKRQLCEGKLSPSKEE